MPAFNYSLVADIYDRYVTTDVDVPFFREELRGVTGRVIELMCGTGRLSLPLLQAGFSLTCVDSSPEMLSLLRKKLTHSGLSAEVVEQDVTALSLSGPYALALIPFNSFLEITAKADQLATLVSIRRCLASTGRLIVTLHNPTVRLKRVDGLSHPIGRFPLDDRGSTFVLRTSEQYDGASELVMGQQVFEASDRDGRALWKRTIDISFRLVSRQQFQDLAVQAGFGLEGVFGDYDRSPFMDATSPFMIWSLRNWWPD
jgi:SAM-dependent methyltransferase